MLHSLAPAKRRESIDQEGPDSSSDDVGKEINRIETVTQNQSAEGIRAKLIYPRTAVELTEFHGKGGANGKVKDGQEFGFWQANRPKD